MLVERNGAGLYVAFLVISDRTDREEADVRVPILGEYWPASAARDAAMGATTTRVCAELPSLVPNDMGTMH